MNRFDRYLELGSLFMAVGPTVLTAVHTAIASCSDLNAPKQSIEFGIISANPDKSPPNDGRTAASTKWGTKVLFQESAVSCSIQLKNDDYSSFEFLRSLYDPKNSPKRRCF